MYLQLTTRCNMTCAHCAMRATAHGTDMSKKVFAAAMAWAQNIGDDSIILGGGEPTLHPRFEDFLWECIRAGIDSGTPPYVITNGSNTKLSLRLALLARKGLVGAAVSKDDYHDYINADVIEAFTVKGTRGDDDMRAIRTVTEILNTGRAHDNNIADDEGCVCPGWTVIPDGGIKPCGCIDAPVLTNVLNPDTKLLDDWQEDVYSDDAHNRWADPLRSNVKTMITMNRSRHA